MALSARRKSESVFGKRPFSIPEDDTLPLRPKAAPANLNSVDSFQDDLESEPIVSDGLVMRAVFFALLGFVGATLFLDYRTMQDEQAAFAPLMPGANPVLPAAPQINSPDGDSESDNVRRAPPVVTDPGQLGQAMTMELVAGGVFRLTGTIDVGSAARFAEMVEGKTEYIKTVQLDSPGGSVTDALDMAARIRQENWNTVVNDGSLCASSCPLVFSGGVERQAGEDAAIGVHQMFTTEQDQRSKAAAISGTQDLTGRISRHLVEMGVDLTVWVHALETPPRSLYYFTSEELADYNLATEIVNS